MIKWLFIVPITLAAIIVGLSIYLQPNSFLGCGDQPMVDTECSAADAIVVVSGGNTAARTEAGINLYKKGWADYLVLAGAAQDKTGLSNAAAMKLQAQQAGVPEYAIILDEESANTQQNAENAQSIFSERDFNDVILVTSGYHQRRASLEFNKLTDGALIHNYPVVSDGDWSWYWWLTPRGWWLAGGEVAKIIAFYFGVSS